MDSSSPHQAMRRVFDDADCLYTANDIDAAIERMAAAMTPLLDGTAPLFLCVMTGGMVFAGQLLTRLPFPLEVGYLHATRYRHATQGGTLDWRVKSDISSKDRVVVLLDDILDEGTTLAEIVKACQTEGASKVYTAVLIDKKHQRKAIPGMKADFTGLEAEDRFLFGYGMDYQGYWRNAPGIYAVKGL